MWKIIIKYDDDSEEFTMESFKCDFEWFSFIPSWFFFASQFHQMQTLHITVHLLKFDWFVYIFSLLHHAQTCILMCTTFLLLHFIPLWWRLATLYHSFIPFTLSLSFRSVIDFKFYSKFQKTRRTKPVCKMLTIFGMFRLNQSERPFDNTLAIGQLEANVNTAVETTQISSKWIIAFGVCFFGKKIHEKCAVCLIYFSVVLMSPLKSGNREKITAIANWK